MHRRIFCRSSSSSTTLVMLIVHNLDHMMQPNEWETLLTREIHGARVRPTLVRPPPRHFFRLRPGFGRHCDARTIVLASVGRRRIDCVYFHPTRCALDSSVSSQSTFRFSTFTCRCHRERKWHRSFSCVSKSFGFVFVGEESLLRLQTQNSSIVKTESTNVRCRHRATHQQFFPSVSALGFAE